jgi:sigma-B regulation protein RsbU (phosphoserine phosphatase)
MAIAASIQRRILSAKMPEGEPFQLHALVIPAREVGGDLYDFFVKDGRVRFCIGDVSGKGVPAALVMALTRTLFRALGEIMEDPSEVMAAVNFRICEDTGADIFVTAFCGSLDLATGRLSYCNAGHDRPLLLRAGRPIRVLEARPGLALGVLPAYAFRTQEEVLEPGSAILLYTDGVTEAMDPAGNLFTLDRLVQALAGFEDQDPPALTQRILEAVQEFAQDAPQADDLTVLGLRFRADEQTEET